MTEVAERASQVPALASTPAIELDVNDIALPRLYIGQYMSHAVQEGRIKAGVLFAAENADDPDAYALWTPAEKPKPGVLIHVLRMRKAKSLQANGELLLFDFDDATAPPEASVTYNYTLCLPEVDPDLPFKWLLTRTGAPAAKKMNTVLIKNSISGPAYQTAFRATTAPRENAKGKYFIAQISPVQADQAHTDIAAAIDAMLGDAPASSAARSDQPAI